MYYRILVNSAADGGKVFRTSRIQTEVALVDAERCMRIGFIDCAHHAEQQYVVEVLAVDDDGEGHILTDEEMDGLRTSVATQPESIGIADPALGQHPIAKANAASWPKVGGTD